MTTPISEGFAQHIANGEAERRLLELHRAEFVSLFAEELVKARDFRAGSAWWNTDTKVVR